MIRKDQIILADDLQEKKQLNSEKVKEWFDYNLEIKGAIYYFKPISLDLNKIKMGKL